METSSRTDFRNLMRCLGMAVCLPGCAASSPQTASVSTPVTPGVFEGDLRKLPTLESWKPGDPVRVIEQKETGGAEDETPATIQGPVMGTVTPSKSGESAEAVRDTGPGLSIRIEGDAFTVADRKGSRLAGPAHFGSLWRRPGGACAAREDGALAARYDRRAGRWLLGRFLPSEGRAPARLCLAVARTSDPLTGGWHLYELETPRTLDLAGLAVRSDTYVIPPPGGSPAGVFSLARSRLLAGEPATGSWVADE